MIFVGFFFVRSGHVGILIRDNGDGGTLNIVAGMGFLYSKNSAENATIYRIDYHELVSPSQLDSNRSWPLSLRCLAIWVIKWRMKRPKGSNPSCRHLSFLTSRRQHKTAEGIAVGAIFSAGRSDICRTKVEVASIGSADCSRGPEEPNSTNKRNSLVAPRVDVPGAEELGSIVGPTINTVNSSNSIYLYKNTSFWA